MVTKFTQPTDFHPDDFLVKSDIRIKWKNFLTLNDAEDIHKLVEKSRSGKAVKIPKDSEAGMNREGDPQYGNFSEEEITLPIPIVDFGNNVVKITEDLDLRGIPVFLPNTKFVLTGETPYFVIPRIILGGSSDSSENPYQEIRSILPAHFNSSLLAPNESGNNQVAVEISGAKNQHIKLGKTTKIHLKMTDDIHSKSIAYSQFDFNFVISLQIGSPGDPAIFWCNENVFNLNRIHSLSIFGGYLHNNNKFVNGSFDYRGSKIDIQSGRFNIFENFRLEEISEIYFGPETNNNTMTVNWNSSIQKSFMFGTKNYTVTDDGFLNRIKFHKDVSSHKQRIFLKIGGMERSQNWDNIVYSPYFDVEANRDLMVLDWDNKNARYLVICECFDKDGNKVAPTSFDSSFLQARAQDGRLQGNYQGGQNYGTRYLIIKDPNIAYVRFGLNNNNQVGEASSKFIVDVYSDKPKFTWNS